MSLTPKNRHVLISARPPEEDPGQTSFVLPDSYKQQADHMVATVLETADDCTLSITVGDSIIVPTNMLLDIAHGSTGYQMILENYVLGVLSRD